MNKLIWGYGVFLLIFTVFSYLFIDGNFPPLHTLYTGFHTSHRELITSLYFIFISIHFLFYIIFFRTKNFLSSTRLKKLIILTVGILIFSYSAMLSFDVFNYTTTSKVLFFYKENPYVTMPIEINDSFLQYTRASNKVALYGPLWIVLTGFPYAIAQNNVLLLLFSMKILVTTFYLGTGYVIWKFSKNIRTTALFLLNPLVVIETLIASHNDVVMIFFALGAFYMLFKKKLVYGFILFLSSVLIKYATIFLLPVFLWVVWKNVRKEAVNWNWIFFLSTVCMSIIFFSSPLREELYPWYFIWVLPFVLLSQSKNIIRLSLIFSYALILRYLPAMYTGDYFGITPIMRSIITLMISVAGMVVFYVDKKFLFKIALFLKKLP